jgi:hypothetical protein
MAIQPKLQILERPPRRVAHADEMMPAVSRDIVTFDVDQPMVICIVDAEEEFDWSAPFATSNNSVTTIKEQLAAQRIFERYGMVPTYAVDYPVAAQEEGYLPLKEFAQSGLCEIGAQLHPWVTPPIEEAIGEANSFACNLPLDLQRRKIATLTSVIERNFGIRPKLFRTGRYGAGPHTKQLLQEFGYEIDCSVLPGPSITPFSPDYSDAPAMPYWLIRQPNILEIPVTAGLVGPLRDFESISNKLFQSSASRWVRLPAVLARTQLLYRVRLSPEGHCLRDAQQLTEALYHAGQRVFAISYHSPSLQAGRTPYTRNQKDVERFLAWIDEYLAFFLGKMRGRPSTPREVRALAMERQSL